MSDPNESSEPRPKIIVDEGWKEKVQAEKEALEKGKAETAATADDNDAAETTSEPSADETAATEQAPPLRLPPADFPGLLTLLATQASMSLSPTQNEQGETVAPVIEIGKHYIDLIGVLEEKTRGNLSDDEAKMISSVLHELRMGFVAVQAAQKK